MEFPRAEPAPTRIPGHPAPDPCSLPDCVKSALTLRWICMKREIPAQLLVGLSILLVGGALIGVEFIWVRLAPVHKARVAEETLKLLPFHSDALGLDMQVAAGFYGKVESFPGGTKIYKPQFFGAAPSIMITSEPNPDHSTEFSPQDLAVWETDGVTKNIPRYHFDVTTINDRNAVMIRQLTTRGMLLTARVISPEHTVVAACSTGGGDQVLLLDACEESLHSIKLTGSQPPANTSPQLEEVAGPPKPAPK